MRKESSMSPGKRDSCRVNVYVRSRPLPADDPTGISSLLFPDMNKVIIQEARHDTIYKFDHVFPLDSTNAEVCKVVSEPLVSSLFSGNNGSFLVYGQTGAGKTHTVLYTGGVIPTTIEHIFAVTKNSDLSAYKVFLSYLQIYQERIYDLLLDEHAGPLNLREHPREGIIVEGLSEEEVKSEDEAKKLVETGQKKLIVAHTQSSPFSSRSHAVCILKVCKRFSYSEILPDISLQVSPEKRPISPEQYECGKLNICDLAGTERTTKFRTSSGRRLDESRHINTSLLELGNVIHALALKNNPYIPFRNSCLTRILQDSLGGNSKASLMVCISASVNDIKETKCSLNFGQRAMKVMKETIANTQPQVDPHWLGSSGKKKRLKKTDYKILSKYLTSKLKELELAYKLEKENLDALKRSKQRETPDGGLGDDVAASSPLLLKRSLGVLTEEFGSREDFSHATVDTGCNTENLATHLYELESKASISLQSVSSTCQADFDNPVEENFELIPVKETISESLLIEQSYCPGETIPFQMVRTPLGESVGTTTDNMISGSNPKQISEEYRRSEIITNSDIDDLSAPKVADKSLISQDSQTVPIMQADEAISIGVSTVTDEEVNHVKGNGHARGKIVENIINGNHLVEAVPEIKPPLVKKRMIESSDKEVQTSRNDPILDDKRVLKTYSNVSTQFDVLGDPKNICDTTEFNNGAVTSSPLGITPLQEGRTSIDFVDSSIGEEKKEGFYPGYHFERIVRGNEKDDEKDNGIPAANIIVNGLMDHFSHDKKQSKDESNDIEIASTHPTKSSIEVCGTEDIVLLKESGTCSCRSETDKDLKDLRCNEIRNHKSNVLYDPLDHTVMVTLNGHIGEGGNIVKIVNGDVDNDTRKKPDIACRYERERDVYGVGEKSINPDSAVEFNLSDSSTYAKSGSCTQSETVAHEEMKELYLDKFCSDVRENMDFVLDVPDTIDGSKNDLIKQVNDCVKEIKFDDITERSNDSNTNDGNMEELPRINRVIDIVSDNCTVKNIVDAKKTATNILLSDETAPLPNNRASVSSKREICVQTDESCIEPRQRLSSYSPCQNVLSNESSHLKDYIPPGTDEERERFINRFCYSASQHLPGDVDFEFREAKYMTNTVDDELYQGCLVYLTDTDSVSDYSEMSEDSVFSDFTKCEGEFDETLQAKLLMENIKNKYEMLLNDFDLVASERCRLQGETRKRSCYDLLSNFKTALEEELIKLGEHSGRSSTSDSAESRRSFSPLHNVDYSSRFLQEIPRQSLLQEIVSPGKTKSFHYGGRDIVPFGRTSPDGAQQKTPNKNIAEPLDENNNIKNALDLREKQKTPLRSTENNELEGIRKTCKSRTSPMLDRYYSPLHSTPTTTHRSSRSLEGTADSIHYSKIGSPYYSRSLSLQERAIDARYGQNTEHENLKRELMLTKLEKSRLEAVLSCVLLTNDIDVPNESNLKNLTLSRSTLSSSTSMAQLQKLSRSSSPFQSISYPIRSYSYKDRRFATPESLPALSNLAQVVHSRQRSRARSIPETTDGVDKWLNRENTKSVSELSQDGSTISPCSSFAEITSMSDMETPCVSVQDLSPLKEDGRKLLEDLSLDKDMDDVDVDALLEQLQKKEKFPLACVPFIKRRSIRKKLKKAKKLCESQSSGIS